MNFYDILFQMKTGKKVPYSKDYFDTLFAAKLADLQIKTLTGTLPLTFKTSETALRSWTIYGNNTEHVATSTSVLPLTFTTTEDKLRDWTIYGNADGVGELVDDHYEIPIYVYPSNLPQIKKDLIGAKVHETQVTIYKGDTPIVCDVIGIDHDEVYYQDGTRAQHSVTLQTHDSYTSLQFDAREALFAFPSGLAAGTYHFTIGQQPWYASDVNKTIQFTLTQAIPADGVLVVNNAYNTTMIGSTISSFASCTAATATETVSMSQGNGGTDLGTVNNSLNGDTNSIQRALMGNNNWMQSAMRQYLNSDKVAGQVWTPQTKWDRPPSWASNTAGFLNGLDEDFVSAVGKVKKTTALNTITDGGGKAENTEKIFLLSRSEVYGGNEVTGGEGTAYPYYSDYSDLSAAGTGSDSNRIKYRNGSAQYWWLRSPNAGGANNVRYVGTSGNVNSGSAYGAVGVAPAFVIPMDEVYNYTFYIGSTPLTAGQSISKTSTGVNITAVQGANTITTDLYNKPEMSIEGVDYVGVGEKSGNSWQIPLTVTHYTDNIFDKDAKNTNKGYEDSTCIMWAGNIPYPYMTGNISEDNNCFVSEKIPVSPNTRYYFTDGIFKNTDNGIYSVFLWNRYRMSDYQAFPTEKTFITGDDTKFIQLCVLKSYADTVMITTKPTETYIPHVEVNNVTIPIDAPLTDGQSITDTQTINTFEGENTIDTTMANKPEMSITYKGG